MEANDAAEGIATRILAQRTFALLASLQRDPNGFVLSQLDAIKADVDRYNLMVDDPRDEKLIRTEAKAILTDLFHGMIQKPSPTPKS